MVPATVVDHAAPHRGDRALFWDTSNWQSLCAHCHNVKSACEDGGFGSAAVLPPGMRPSLVPLVVVCGAPGSGKSAWVADHAQPRDLVLDLDAIRARLGGARLYEAPEATYRPAMEWRNARLMQLCRDPVPWPAAWLIASAPSPAARSWWRTKAGARVVVLGTELEVCLARIAADTRRHEKAWHESAARAWWAAYRADPADEVVGCG